MDGVGVVHALHVVLSQFGARQRSVAVVEVFGFGFLVAVRLVGAYYVGFGFDQRSVRCL